MRRRLLCGFKLGTAISVMCRGSRLACLLILAPFACIASAQETTDVLTVDVSSDTGAILHGATGWLYGQSEPGIPTVSTMALLKPQISAQKPPGGLQHPSGDALRVAEDYKLAGGREMQIYIQDAYPDWPYNYHPIEEYVETVQAIVRRAKADKNAELFSYVPFNEPEYNWYGYSGPPFEKFLADWKAVYAAIRSIDPDARIVGPNYSNYKSDTYRRFLVFAKENKVLPQEISWHELQDNSYPGWYERIDDYRKVESEVGVRPIPIVINEYTRANGDLAVPGNLVQWIARLENRKVQGCLAYWTPSGTLSDLVARTWANRVTGAWWVYEWYAAMEGTTVSVSPPDPFGFGVQAVATVEKSKRQVRVLFGGAGHADVLILKIRGLNKLDFIDKSVHYQIWRIDGSGIEPSPGPVVEREGQVDTSTDEISVSLSKPAAKSAYYLILCPGHLSRLTEATPTGTVHYRAEYAQLRGGVAVAYDERPGSLTNGSVVFGADPQSGVDFPVTVNDDGYYELRLSLVLASSNDSRPTELGVDVNGTILQDFVVPPTSPKGQRSEITRRVFLAGGINRISFRSTSKEASEGVHIVALDVIPAQGSLPTFAASDPANLLHGNAKLISGSNAAAPYATLIGKGKENFLEFRGLEVPSSGRYKMVVTYTNSETGHSGQIERYADIQANSGPGVRVYFRNTFDPKVFRTNVVDIDLKKGSNSIRFSNPDGYAPDIQMIQIATP